MINTRANMKTGLNLKSLVAFLAAIAILFMPLTANADFADERKIIASDNAAGDLFGGSVFIEGDTVIAGGVFNDGNGTNSGAAYVFVRDPGTGAWTEQQKLQASDGAANDRFGASVAVSGDTAIAGAINDISVYVFVRDPGTGIWTEQQKLLPSDGVSGELFGNTVSISGDTVIVGAQRDADNGTRSGSAYVFVRDPGTGVWTEQQKLLASDGAAYNYFGASVSINGDTAVAGATGQAAYVFIRNPDTGVWTEQQKLVASDSIINDNFGISVSLKGDSTIVGASGSSRSAYVFVRDPDTGVWTEQQKLLASDDVGSNYFGISVSISGDRAIVGANGNNAAYLYVRDPATSVWTEQQKLTSSDGVADDQFGASVSISGESAIAGVWGDDDNGTNSGSAYVYRESIATAPDITVTDSVAPDNDLQVLFGNITEGSFSDQTVTVTNDGDADLILGDIAVADPLVEPFSILIDNCSTQTLSPAANCTLTVRFSPTSTGYIAGSFDIPSNDPIENPVTVSVSGVGIAAPVADITVTDSVAPVADLQIPFGNVTEATTSDQTVTITNDGNADLVLGDLALIDILVAPFSIFTDNCSSLTLTPAASCTVTVRFAPTIAGTFNDSFDIPSNDPDENPVTFSMSGTGTAAVPDITVTDSVTPTADLQILFGDVTEATTSDQTVTVTNDGSADLVLGDVATANSLALPFSVLNDNCSGQTLAAATSCTMTVRFAPTATGVSNDSFDIPSNDPDENPITVNVTGTGTPIPVPDITVSDAVAPVDDLQVPFGDVTEATTSDQVVTVTNNGNANLVVGNVAIINPLAAPFSVQSDGCSAMTLAPSNSCTVTIRFAPTATGTLNDSFDIPSNDPDEASVTVSVNGTGTPTPVPDITVTDSIAPVDDLQIPFTDLTVAGTSDQTVTVTNDGNADLVMGNVAVANALAAPFSVVNDNCSGQTVAAVANCTFDIRFSPITAGTFNDSLDIPSNDTDENSVTVNVSGSGLAGTNNPPSSPNHVFPANGQQSLGTTVTLEWQPATDPDGDIVSYDVHHCTESDPVNNCNSLAEVASLNIGLGNGVYYASLGLGGGIMILGITLAGGIRSRRQTVLLIAALIISSLLASCGGGDEPDVNNNKTYTVTGLNTGTTYYWAIVAIDGNGGKTPGTVWSYSTL